MNHLRAVVRVTLVIVVTGVVYLFWILGNLVFLPSDERRRALRRFIVRNWSRATARIIGMRITVLGRPPEPPYLLVANHLSYVDAMLVLCCMDGILISKADVRQWPVFGHLAWLSDALFIDRSIAREVVRVNALIIEALERGDGVIFFPESTSTRGLDVQRFRSPLLAFPAEQGMPVHYATIRYETRPPDPPAALSVCWWGTMTFLDHLYRMLKLRGFDARIHFGENPVHHEDRKELADLLRERIAANFCPVRQADEEILAAVPHSGEDSQGDPPELRIIRQARR